MFVCLFLFFVAEIFVSFWVHQCLGSDCVIKFTVRYSELITLKLCYFSISSCSQNRISSQAQQEYHFQSWVRQDRKFSHLISLYWNNCLKFILWCYPVYDAEWDIIQWEGNYFNGNLSYKNQVHMLWGFLKHLFNDFSNCRFLVHCFSPFLPTHLLI